jgi:hypothetical protein
MKFNKAQKTDDSIEPGFIDITLNKWDKVNLRCKDSVLYAHIVHTDEGIEVYYAGISLTLAKDMFIIRNDV